MVTTKNKRTEAPSTADLQALLAAVEHTDDVVEFTLRCVLALGPEFTGAVREAAERHVREMFGGSRVYVARRAGEGTVERNQSIRLDYLRGERLSLLSRRYGLSERRILQIIKAPGRT